MERTTSASEPAGEGMPGLGADILGPDVGLSITGASTETGIRYGTFGTGFRYPGRGSN